MSEHDHDHHDGDDGPLSKLPVPDEVQDAIRTLIRWAGDDPSREGLLETPARVARAWKEYCQGYTDDPGIHLAKVFHEVGGYEEIVLLKDIPFQSHCEHHMAPIIGKASIAYLPRKHVVGISKLARVLHGFAQRLQIQERLTAEVAQCIWDHLKPQGVAVVIGAARLHDGARRAYAGRRDDHQPADGGIPGRRVEPEGSAEPDGLLAEMCRSPGARNRVAPDQCAKPRVRPPGNGKSWYLPSIQPRLARYLRLQPFRTHATPHPQRYGCPVRWMDPRLLLMKSKRNG